MKLIYASTTMLMPYLLLYLWDANYGALSLGNYFTLTAILAVSQFLHFRAGYRWGFHVSKMIGIRAFGEFVDGMTATLTTEESNDNT